MCSAEDKHHLAPLWCFGDFGAGIQYWQDLCFALTTMPLRNKYPVGKKKVKASHTRYRALGPELIPVYRQSARR